MDDILIEVSYAGFLSLEEYGEAFGVLFLSSLDVPLAEELTDKIAERTVTVSYWITEQKCSRDKAQEEFMKYLLGSADCEFQAQYSEATGYLWTDEEIMIGGHDLLDELKSNVGKWLILDIKIHSTEEKDG